MTNALENYNKELDKIIDSLGEVEKFELTLGENTYEFEISLDGCLKIEEKMGMSLEEIFMNIFGNVDGENYLDFLITILPYFCKQYIDKDYLLDAIPLTKQYLQLLDAIFLCVGGIVDSTQTYKLIYKQKMIDEMIGDQSKEEVEGDKND